jgi:hypothetical protein
MGWCYQLLLHYSSPDGTGLVAQDDLETKTIKWVGIHEAAQYLSQTTNLTGKKRNLVLLADAIEIGK